MTFPSNSPTPAPDSPAPDVAAALEATGYAFIPPLPTAEQLGTAAGVLFALPGAAGDFVSVADLLAFLRDRASSMDDAVARVLFAAREAHAAAGARRLDALRPLSRDRNVAVDGEEAPIRVRPLEHDAIHVTFPGGLEFALPRNVPDDVLRAFVREWEDAHAAGQNVGRRAAVNRFRAALSMADVQELGD